MYALLASSPGQATVTVHLLTEDGTPAAAAQRVARPDLPATVAAVEAAHHPRWVWERASAWYPELLTAGVSVARCHDLALCQAILLHSTFTAGTDYAAQARVLPRESELPPPAAPSQQESLFEAPTATTGWWSSQVAAELAAQKRAVAASTQPARLALLLSAESACALVAAEMAHAGMPWREDLHRELLQELLGPEPTGYARPVKMEQLVATLRTLLDAPTLNPDSPQELMRALHRAGIDTKSTRSWELQEFTHPVIEPLLAYRKLSRLFTTNGWAWLEQWVQAGRFHSEYVVGGVVSGRWASRGGGAMQIPRQIRGAVRADPGYRFIVADAAQLEPRVLTALAQDSAMATAGRDKDLYAGIAAQGFGGDRAMAKLALLGAIYGSTSGESGRLMPQLTRMYPQAVGFSEEAARAGERGEPVTTWLGRSTPAVSADWRAAQRSDSEQEQRRAEAAARTRGRFTRNFVVQGTAAEWACCWLAELRRRLRTLPEVPDSQGSAGRAQMVFFLHDEVVVHCPDAQVAEVTATIQAAAQAATALLFGQIPLEFPLSVAVVDNYADAK